MEKDLLSMSQATQFCNYSQDYLSLLARRGVLEAKKIGRKWYTTRDWLNEYLKVTRPNELITQNEEETQSESVHILKSPQILKWSLVAMSVLLAIVAFSFWNTARRINQLEQKSNSDKFIPNKIIQFPNDEGKIETYASGMIRSNN
jgi:hypothetical protein